MLAERWYQLDNEMGVTLADTKALCLAFNRGDVSKERFVELLTPKRTGENVRIMPPFHCDYGINLELGDNVYFNANCCIIDCAPVVIKAGVMFGPNVSILTANHPLSVTKRKEKWEKASIITFEEDVWVGANVVVTAGVTIGRGAVIAAGAVVTQNVPAGQLWGGKPAKYMRDAEDT
eukprot:Trichotokara_eunicae@DN4786_c0_g1_i2.p1